MLTPTILSIRSKPTKSTEYPHSGAQRDFLSGPNSQKSIAPTIGKSRDVEGFQRISIERRLVEDFKMVELRGYSFAVKDLEDPA